MRPLTETHPEATGLSVGAQDAPGLRTIDRPAANRAPKTSSSTRITIWRSRFPDHLQKPSSMRTRRSSYSHEPVLLDTGWRHQKKALQHFGGMSLSIVLSGDGLWTDASAAPADRDPCSKMANAAKDGYPDFAAAGFDHETHSGRRVIMTLIRGRPRRALQGSKPAPTCSPACASTSPSHISTERPATAHPPTSPLLDQRREGRHASSRLSIKGDWHHLDALWRICRPSTKPFRSTKWRSMSAAKITPVNIYNIPSPEQAFARSSCCTTDSQNPAAAPIAPR
jgi:hypothetical protein